MRRNNKLPMIVLILLAMLLLAGTLVALVGSFGGSTGAASSAASSGAASLPVVTPAPTTTPGAITQPPEMTGESDKYKAVWISYLEYQNMDFSSEAAFTAEITAMFDQIKAAGLNRVLLHVRPAGDAMYRSEVFPWSHFLTGTQGKDPGYDPLEIMVREAHARGLAAEAWVNPYRVRIGANKPETLAVSNPAAKYMQDEATAGWVHEVDGGLWYDPAVPEVRQLIVDGVAELCKNYDIDGVQFDDYFYPTTDPSFDAAAYEKYGEGKALDEWRRSNVNQLVRAVYDTVKAVNPKMTFGISPQGNADNNFGQQYSDVGLWMREPGFVDYVCPQIYWGFDYRTSSGSNKFAFDVCTKNWLDMPRDDSVALYVGLGAYRIGEGDGSSQESSEWQSGTNLAKMVKFLREAGADGYAVYRYDNLFRGPSQLIDAERAALTQANNSI